MVICSIPPLQNLQRDALRKFIFKTNPKARPHFELCLNLYRGTYILLAFSLSFDGIVTIDVPTIALRRLRSFVADLLKHLDLEVISLERK